jgi:hypothetical protein
MNEKARLFLTAFLQVSLVTANTALITRNFWLGIFTVSFLISYVWAFNVKKVSIGTETDRRIYALGAAFGGTFGAAAVHWLAAAF